MPAKAKTLADFRSVHDRNVVIPQKINNALVAMFKEGAENWEYEVDFVRRAGISQTDLGQFRAKFEDNIVNVGSERNPKRVWFADKKAATKARGE